VCVCACVRAHARACICIKEVVLTKFVKHGETVLLNKLLNLKACDERLPGYPRLGDIQIVQGRKS
jgi:hypothetical protein